MNIKPIKNEQNYQESLSIIESLMDAKPNTPQMDELEVVTTLVELYEEQHYKIDAPDPIEVIKFRMEQEGLTRSHGLRGNAYNSNNKIKIKNTQNYSHAGAWEQE